MTNSSPYVDETLRTVVRRYRLTPLAIESAQTPHLNPSTQLAIAIEQGRQTITRGEKPSSMLQCVFVAALAQLIKDAMRPASADPAFAMMLLKHRFPNVNEYVALSSTARDDYQTIRKATNAIAHPGKLRHMTPGAQRDALSGLHHCVSSSTWHTLDDTVLRLLDMPEVVGNASLNQGLKALLESKALQRLRRIEVLETHEHVSDYRAMRDRYGPASKSAMAVSEGAISQQRGAEVESLAAQACGALAERLNELEKNRMIYRTVTSMCVPRSMPGHPDRAKGEWDVVLLKRAHADPTDEWDICLLIEAKASIDAAATDFPRLLRGLRSLAKADENVVYAFETQQGIVRLRGASLRALPTTDTRLAATVLYCSDASAENAPRLLGAASRMQLLSAHASLDYASALARTGDADSRILDVVWHDVLNAPRWHAVLNQYPTLSTVRELMVHPDDLLAAINRQETGDAQSTQARAPHAKHPPEIGPDTATGSSS
ncbi:MAG TPA: 3-deoxy-D-arabino-heptulosonate 7-phosphate synthase [Pararobbsia sp.]|nr:3-deoxy-D-arabino-heptulosonate 7-phosphate synthase [Pararobbsia sp.]